MGAKYYQGNRSPNEIERREKGYSAAWLHHKGRNKHHLEYWIDYSPEGDHALAGMKMPGFLLYTIVGSTVWNLLLVGIGAAVGAAWEQAAEYVKLYADVVFLILMVGTVCFPAFHLYRKKHRQK